MNQINLKQNNTGTSHGIVNGIVLTMDNTLQTYEPGMVLYTGNTITYVGPHQENLIDSIAPENMIDAERGIILPGFINTHTHIGMSLFRTLADDTPDRLRKVLFPLEKKFVTPELVYWASLHTISEMILGGITTFADMYYYETQTAKAAIETGIRAIVGQSISHDPSPDSASAQEGLERTLELATFLATNDRVSAAIAPHAPYTLTREELELCAELSANHNLHLLSHLAEMPFEEPFTQEKYGMRPVPFYHSCGLLNAQATMAHCIFCNEHDRTLLIQTETGISHNPSANSKSGKGIAPAYEFFQQKARIGIGTDGPMSGNTMDLLHQLGIVSKLQKTRLNDPTVMTPRQVLHMATIGGAKALHKEDSIGSLEVGKRADIVIISAQSPAMYPIYDPYSAIVYGASPSDVSTVVVDGRLLMHKRILLHMDLQSIRGSATYFVEKIRGEQEFVDSGATIILKENR
jgi:5-methylthioadenosine/S-adenosylhomocysteine deaminase